MRGNTDPKNSEYGHFSRGESWKALKQMGTLARNGLAHQKPYQTSKMERFVEIVNGFSRVVFLKNAPS